MRVGLSSGRTFNRLEVTESEIISTQTLSIPQTFIILIKKKMGGDNSKQLEREKDMAERKSRQEAERKRLDDEEKVF